MAEQQYTNIGTCIAVSLSDPATFDQAGFEALSDYQDIGQITTVAERGALAEKPTVAFLKTGVQQYFLGTVDYGSYAVTIVPSFADGGQDLIRDHVVGTDKGDNVTIRETDPAGNIRYSQGLVSDYRYSEASPSATATVNFTISQNTTYVEVEA